MLAESFETRIRELVRCRRRDPFRSPFTDAVDLAFQLPASTRPLRLGDSMVRSDTAQYLAYRVVRSPGDLCAHVRRIFLHYDLSDPDGLYAALLDLFIALCARGPSLREHLLKGARSRLKQHHYQALSKGIEQGITAATSVPPAFGSVLTTGVCGRADIVRLVEQESERIVDPLVEARGHIEFSQIEQARCVLENAILEQPRCAELHADLLEIYRSTRDKENFFKFFSQIDRSENPMLDRWEALAAEFSVYD